MTVPAPRRPDPPDEGRFLPRLRRPAPRAALAWAARTCLVVGLACLGWAAWVLAESATVDAVETRRLEEARATLPHAGGGEDLRDPDRPSPRAPSTPSWGEPDEGDLIGRIEISRIELSGIVQAGVTRRTLRRAVGHIPGTALPGEKGNVGLAGHRDSFFRPLADVAEGDTIQLATPHGDFVYRVDRTFVVDPEDTWVLEPAGDAGEMVTLVSCYPFYWVGPAPRRFIVQGRHLPTTGVH